LNQGRRRNKCVKTLNMDNEDMIRDLSEKVENLEQVCVVCN